MKTKPPKENMPQMGQILRKYVTEHRIRQAAWGRKQGIKASNVAQYLKRPDMRISTLITICRMLNYNFFWEVMKYLPADMPPVQENPLQKEVAKLQLENEKLQEKVEMLLGILGKK